MGDGDPRAIGTVQTRLLGHPLHYRPVGKQAVGLRLKGLVAESYERIFA